MKSSASCWGQVVNKELSFTWLCFGADPAPLRDLLELGHLGGEWKMGWNQQNQLELVTSGCAFSSGLPWTGK